MFVTYLVFCLWNGEGVLEVEAGGQVGVKPSAGAEE